MRTTVLCLLIGVSSLACTGCQRATLVKEHGRYELKTTEAADDYPSHFDDHRRNRDIDGPFVRPSPNPPPPLVTPEVPEY
jgi:hypothetical protein